MSTSLDLLKRHLEAIYEKNYKIVNEISKKKLEILITFDDGFRGLYENFSFFIDNKIPVKLFVVYNYLGKKSFITESELLDIFSTGLLTVGSHTMSHIELHTLNRLMMCDELTKSKEKLEDLLNCNITDICYPNGRFSPNVISLARQIGYIKQFSCLPGSYYNYFNGLVIRRNLVQSVNKKEFIYILNGASNIFYKRYLRRHFYQNSSVG